MGRRTKLAAATHVRIGYRRVGLVCFTLCFLLMIGMGRPPIAMADAPAVTDFGQALSMPAFASSDQRRAMFITLYPDGRHEAIVRSVSNDAVVSFAGEHAAWALDSSLSLFVQMPVYVRVVHESPYGGGTLGV